MMCLARSRAVLCVAFLALVLVSCNPFGHVRPGIKRGTHPGLPNLLEATKPELIRKVSEFYDAINSFSLECRLVASTGSVYKGQITDYVESQGYIDLRKPSDIRVVGVAPLIGTAFNMVSDGKTFKVSIPPKSRFYEGDNDAPPASANKLENIRPGMFLEAMLIKPVDPATEKTIMADDTTMEYSYYQLAIIKTLPNGELQLERRITFDRVTLLMIEERQYAPDGTIVSLTHYGDWTPYNGARFPNHIDISRPKEEIAVEINVTKMDMNNQIADAKFVLAKPEGFELKTITKTPSATPAEPPKGSH